MNFFEELEWRNMLHDAMPGAKEVTNSGMCTGYIGFDPTAPSMTIGNYVQIMVLSLWQRSGHKPIVLMGGATGRIGDPSGKDSERQLKSYEELDANLNHQIKQMEKFLDFSPKGNGALLRNNLDFYKDMNALDFLRDIGKTLTVSYMLSKDSVKNRLESGLSFTEFSYQLLQSYDFQVLYQQDNCHFQMGGSDQWGNITSGAEFIRRNLTDSKAYAVTSKLLAKSDGKKFGKSEKGNIWLDPEMTTPYQFYQFWKNADDADLPMFTRYFSMRSQKEVLELENDLKDDQRQLKEILAEEITTRVHSKEAFDNVKDVSQILFSKKLDFNVLNNMDEDSLNMVSKEITTFEVDKSIIANGINIVELATTHCPIFSSLSDGRRKIKENAVSINKQKISDQETNVNTENLIKGKYVLIENGKKNKYLVKAV
ncbi:MAG: tyrosine--tRNA ligase [Saprospiraceae bacterium]|nr:tyrosine--tRNA ligase [Bacteroidia bacterium]NNE16744.1 tyrosine--tRNA ligase [Saprospiraceae bacterium]NNL92646.1 tyrosine--tRNA ligase [Saprospiraceae bacterium]